MLKSYDKKFNMTGFKSNLSLVYLCEIFIVRKHGYLDSLNEKRQK